MNELVEADTKVLVRGYPRNGAVVGPDPLNVLKQYTGRPDKYLSLTDTTRYEHSQVPNMSIDMLIHDHSWKPHKSIDMLSVLVSFFCNCHSY